MLVLIFQSLSRDHFQSMKNVYVYGFHVEYENIKNVLKVSKEIKQCVKIQLLNLINDFEQFFPMGIVIK